MTQLRIVPLALVAMVSLATWGPAQEPTTEFIIRRGKDTVSIERFSRDAATLSGNIAQSNGQKYEYLANLRPNSTVEHIEMQRSFPNGQSGTLSVDFGDTLVTATFSNGTETQNRSLATLQKPLPFLILSFALCEQIVRASRPEVGKPVKWSAVRLGAGDTATMTVTRVNKDSVTISVPQGDIKMAVSPSGDVIGAVYVPPQPPQWTVERKQVAKP